MFADIIDAIQALKHIELKKPAPHRIPVSTEDHVNAAALANLDQWVPVVFPDAIEQSSGAYRVTSAGLQQPEFEEDLSIHPDGIRDFGQERGLTPILLLAQYCTVDGDDLRAADRDAKGNRIGTMSEFEARQWLVRHLGLETITAEERAKFGVIYHEDCSDFEEPHDFVEGMLCEGTTCLVIGDSNVGKSFLVLDIAQHVASGWEWHGLQVDAGGVVYLAGEGAHGVKARVKAFRQHYGQEKTAGAKFGMITTTGDFMNETEVELVIKSCLEAKVRFGSLKMVVVDTLARALKGGDENSATDMNKAIAAADRIVKATGAAVVIIHHSGKDKSKGARGHSSLRAAVDSEFEVTRASSTAPIKLHTTKQRDMEFGKDIFFDLQSVELGTNRRGKPIRSAVVIPNATAAREVTITDNARAALEALRSLVDDEHMAPLKTWRETMFAAYEAGGLDKQNTKNTRFNKERDDLAEAGKIQLDGTVKGKPDVGSVILTDF